MSGSAVRQALITKRGLRLMKSGYKRKLCISGIILTALLFEVVVPKLFGGAPMPLDALIAQIALGIPAMLLLVHSESKKRHRSRN
jgi:hypothetical protein